MTEYNMVGWHHRLNGHEFEQALGDGEGQGSLACCSPWGHKESDTTEQLNKTPRHRAKLNFINGNVFESFLPPPQIIDFFTLDTDD